MPGGLALWIRLLASHTLAFQTVGPDSVGYRLTSEALCFGGRTMTATDIAVAFGQAPEIAADTQQLKDIGLSEMGKAALKLIRQNVEAAIDHVKVCFRAADVMSRLREVTRFRVSER